MTETPVKTNYLNNKDLLKEIHLSKNSYCSFLNPADDHAYDMIVSNKKDINADTILKAQQIRATKLEKLTKTKIDPMDILPTDLIFRVTTWEHIPKAPAKKKVKNKNTIANFIKDIEPDDSLSDIVDEELIEQKASTKLKMAHVKVNFPPFFHYKLTKKGNLKLVGKSHWEGDLKTGQFNKFHGQITDTLAYMIIKLCDRYGSRSNWRGYTYAEEMKGQAILQLSAMVLQFDESKSQNPFAYMTSTVHNSFLRILNIEKRNQNVRDDLLEQQGLNPSFARQSTKYDE